MLNMGILLLGAPPFLIMAGYCYLFYKKNQVTGAADEVDAARETDSPLMNSDEHR